MKVDSSTILVTGAASGIGRAAAERLAEQGATVIAVDRDEKGLESLRHPAIECRRCDIGDAEALPQLVNVLAEAGRLPDALINNAAVLKDQALAAKLGKHIKMHSLEDWNETLRSNLTGSFLCARELSACWIEHRRPGVIVNTSSVVRSGNPGQSAYACTKAAMDALTVTWSRELAPYRIRVAAIAYGFAETGMTQSIPAMFREQLRRRSVLGRFADVQELVAGITFILENDYFAGRILELDGGMRF